MHLDVARFAYTKMGTLSAFTLYGDDGHTITEGYLVELPWRGNKKWASCIPERDYRAIRHDSPKHGDSFWIKNVPGRTEILIHVGNSMADLDGCLAPGDSYGWAGDWWDGVERPERKELAVWNSRDTLGLLLDEVGEAMSVSIRQWQPGQRRE